MNAGIIFGQMLVLFAMMLAGYVSCKKEWATEEASGRLSKLVVNIFNPILVIDGVLGQSSGADAGRIGENLLMTGIYFVILVIFSFVLAAVLRPGKHRISMFRMLSIFSNIGFMGIPVIKSIYGDQAMIYVAFYILAYNLLLYTYGYCLAGKAALEYEAAGKPATAGNTEALAKKPVFKKIVNPGVLAALLAVLIFVSGIRLPGPVNTFCDYMGDATIPLSMMLIGVSVAQADLKQIFSDIRMYLFILIRMVLLPAAMVFLLGWLPVDGVVFGVFIIELSMPVGSIVSLMAKESGADMEYCTKGVVLSTLASIITIPVICMFL